MAYKRCRKGVQKVSRRWSRKGVRLKGAYSQKVSKGGEVKRYGWWSFRCRDGGYVDGDDVRDDQGEEVIHKKGRSGLAG